MKQLMALLLVSGLTVPLVSTEAFCAKPTAAATHERAPRHKRHAGGDSSPSTATPFTDTLLESELFGHLRGSFTGAVADTPGLFAEADGGTISLDEVGDVSPALQAKLLRVLQEHQVRPVGGTTWRAVDARVIAATNRDLAAAVAAGRFARTSTIA